MRGLRTGPRARLGVRRAGGLPDAVRVVAHAKLNLGLAIGPRRPDGYHDLATVFQSVSLADCLVVRRRPRGFSLAVSFEDASLRRAGLDEPGAGAFRRRVSERSKVPGGSDNLVLQAARLLADRHGIRGGARFELVKRIPARAGLGGGSADAAAALIGLARLNGIHLSRAQRMELAATLGSDVPFAITGGTALGFGRGERLSPVRLERPFRAIVAVPDWGISTALAFRRIDRGKYGLTGWRANLRFVQSLEREAVRPEQTLRLGNTFEDVLGNRRSDFVSLCARLQDVGVGGTRLTGSGSAVLGILGPSTPLPSVLGRFRGSERLYLVRSVRAGVRVATLR